MSAPEPDDPPPLDWGLLLADQVGWLWTEHVRPRLRGLSDDEYLWEPVPGCWSVRPRGQGVAVEVGGGAMVIDFAFPEPDPPPVTTIAWRIGHLLVGVFGERNARHFGGPAVDYASYDYPGTAEEALARLDDGAERWLAGVRGLDDTALRQPCGEPGFEQDPLAALVLHINREVLHHGAEIALLRDLYRAAPGRAL
jgi:hypothetical protein